MTHNLLWFSGVAVMELKATILWYLSVLPHVLLFIATLGLSKAIMDALQEHREKKVLVAKMTAEQKIRKESNERWMALRQEINVYDPIAVKAYTAKIIKPNPAWPFGIVE